MENPLCTTKTVVWVRWNLFANPTRAELQRGLIRQVNLMDPQQTDLPQFDLAHLNCVAGGPYQVKLSPLSRLNTMDQTILIYLTMIN